MKHFFRGIHIPEWIYCNIPKLTIVCGALLLIMGSIASNALNIILGIFSLIYGLTIHIKRSHLKDPHQRAMRNISDRKH